MDAKYKKKISQNFCESFTNSYFYQVRIKIIGTKLTDLTK